MKWTPEENSLNFPPAQAWNDHPFRRPTTYCELLNQRQERQARTLTGGHPRLDGVNTSTPEDSVCPPRPGKESASSRSGRAKTVAWADEELHRTAQATKVRSRTPMEEIGGSAATNRQQSAAEKAEAEVAAALALRTAAAARKRVERTAWANHHKHVHVRPRDRAVQQRTRAERVGCGRVDGLIQPHAEHDEALQAVDLSDGVQDEPVLVRDVLHIILAARELLSVFGKRWRVGI